MTAFLSELIRNHGWHVAAELGVLVLVSVFSTLYLVSMFRGRVRSVVCPSCGRVASRARTACPRCGEPLEATG